MKKAICLLIALSLLLSLGACAANKPSSRPQEVVSGGGAIHFSSSEADREPAVPENPPAVPEEEGPSYAPIPSSSTPSYASSSISYPSSSSSSAALPPSSSSSVAPAPSSMARYRTIISPPVSGRHVDRSIRGAQRRGNPSHPPPPRSRLSMSF